MRFVYLLRLHVIIYCCNSFSFYKRVAKRIFFVSKKNYFLLAIKEKSLNSWTLTFSVYFTLYWILAELFFSLFHLKPMNMCKFSLLRMKLRKKIRGMFLTLVKSFVYFKCFLLLKSWTRVEIHWQFFFDIIFFCIIE